MKQEKLCNLKMDIGTTFGNKVPYSLIHNKQLKSRDKAEVIKLDIIPPILLSVFADITFESR